jgi:MIP family channel proteins
LEQPPYAYRLAAEVIGTFGFFFLGFSGVAIATDLPGSIAAGAIPAGFGLGLGLMIFAFGHVSGGHFNPAVTLGLTAGGKFPAKELPGYWIAQLIGGFAAMGTMAAIYSDKAKDALVNAPGLGDGAALSLEIIATALFLIVISALATDNAPWSGILAPIAIGGFIFVAATVVGPASGGSFNPARSIAPAIYGGEMGDLWIYIVGPLVGGLIGGVIFALVRQRKVGVPEL